MNLFATLCNDKTAAVRLAAATNPNCSIAGLKVLAASQFYEYHELAARHKNCTRDLFEVLANNSVESVREAVIENNDCPIGIRAPLFMTKKPQSKSVQVDDDEEIEPLTDERKAEQLEDRLDVESIEDLFEKRVD